MRRRSTFRKADLAPVVQAVRDAGVNARFEIDLDARKITFTTLNPDGEEQTTDLDTWMKKRAG